MISGHIDPEQANQGCSWMTASTSDQAIVTFVGHGNGPASPENPRD